MASEAGAQLVRNTRLRSSPLGTALGSRHQTNRVQLTMHLDFAWKPFTNHFASSRNLSQCEERDTPLKLFVVQEGTESLTAQHQRPIGQDSLAEWSKALASGASPQGRGFEPHSCHSVNKYTQGSLLTTVTAPLNTCCHANPWKEYQETSGALGAGYF